ELTNSARPIVPPAPPLFVTCAPALWMPSDSSDARTARPVASHPPPGLAGTMSLMGSAACARSGTTVASVRSASDRSLIRDPSSGGESTDTVRFARSFYRRGAPGADGALLAQDSLEDATLTGTVRPDGAGRQRRVQLADLVRRKASQTRREVGQPLPAALA